MMMNKKAGLPALVLLAAVIMAGCAQDAEQPPQPKAGVLTVSGVEDGVFYEADVYDWPDAVADAADLTDIMSDAEPDGTGTGSADNETLEIDLETPDGEAFTSDGKFLVVIKDAEDDSAPLKYKTFVLFTGGRAAVKYSTMKTATDDPNGTDKPSESGYTVTFHINGGTPADFTQEVQSGGKATLPAPPTRQGYTFDGWYTSADYTTKWNFGADTVTESITLYGTWTRNSYKVTFDTGGIAPTPEPLPAVQYASMITEPAMTKTGYTFDGWYKDNTKTTRWDFDKNTVTESITLYGTWIKNPVVTFFVDGVVNKTVDVPTGSKVVMPNLDAKAGYTLDGWYTSTAYTTKWDFGTDTVTADITLYAKWKPLTFAVLLADMAADAAANTEKTYTLPSGSETYNIAVKAPLI